MRFKTVFVVLGCFLFAGCEDIFLNENSTANVSAVIESDELVIRNGLHFDVYYFAVDQETSYLIDWIPLEREENRIRPNETRVFSTDDIVGYDPDKNVLVFIWGNNQEYWDGVVIKP